MNFKEHAYPRPHVIFKDFLPEKLNLDLVEEAILMEVEPGKVINFIDTLDVNSRGHIDKDLKDADDVDVDTFFKNRKDSIILTTMDKYVWSEEMRNLYQNLRFPIFNQLGYTDNDSTHLIRYTNGQYYNFHEDKSGEERSKYDWVTISYMLCKQPQMFKGGEFVLKYNDEEKVIPFKNNTLIIFANNTMHAVKPVKMLTDDISYARYSIQHWSTN